MTNKCSLCDAVAELCQSHVIPKFVYRWLKETSATGLIRSSKDVNRLYQDGYKIKLLCRDCESKFSEWETRFANEIFWPYIKENKVLFDYNEWLTKFIISLNWRLLVNKAKDDKILSKNAQKRLSIAEYRFKKYLLGQRTSHGHYLNNLIFLDYIENANFNVPVGLTRYLGRAIDSTIAYKGNEELWVCIKLGRIMIVTIIVGQELLEWRNSQVDPVKGNISSKQEICGKLGSWFLRRNEEIKKIMQSYTGKYKSKFWEKIKKDPDSFIKTETFKSYLEEERLTGKLPKF